MSSYVIPVFPAASRVPPRDALAARLSELTGRFAELSAELAAISSAVASVSGKADKAPPAAAGNLASLDASGNLSDSGKSPSDFAPASGIAKSALAPAVQISLNRADTAVQASQLFSGGQIRSGLLPSFVDDVLEYSAPSGFPQSGETGKIYVAKSTNKTYRWSGSQYVEVAASPVTSVNGRTGAVVLPIPDPQVNADWNATAGIARILNKPSIPAVDAALATRGAAADAKAVGDALRSGFTEWEFSGTEGVPADQILSASFRGAGGWFLEFRDGAGWSQSGPASGTGEELSVAFQVATESYDPQLYGVVTATRHAFPPTKTSQLANDSGFLTSHQDISGKADKVADATAGNLASLDEQGNLADSGVKPSDFAAKSDLPYRLVEPGKWEFSDEQSHTISGPSEGIGGYYYDLDGLRASDYFNTEADALAALSIAFDGFPVVTATRPSLPGHLLDRAVNAVPVSGATTITLPEKIDGKSRDFHVRLTVGAESAVTFAATDSGGDAVAWDSMGDPSGTFAEGTYLYRLTEVADGVFHAADITSGGSIDPAVLDGKLDATSAAPAFDPTLTYLVGEYVTYGGILYRCKIAVTVAGAWTGDSNWVDVDMTSPDATLDIRSDGRLAVVAADSEILWIQGYDMASASDVVLSCEKVNFYAFASGTDSVTFNMPSAPGGKVGDFVLDIDNSANASTQATADLNGFGTSFDVIVPKGQNLFTDILSFEGGEMCELYFTMTAFGTAAKPAWKVVKQVVEKQEAGS